MAHILLIQHLPSSHAGLVGEWLVDRQHTFELCRTLTGDPLPSPDAFEGTVIFGGPQGANDPCPYLDRETRWIATALADKRRLLGICLGAQLMAKALGARVGPREDGKIECGYTWVDPVPENVWLTEPRAVYHWHRDGFTLPKGATLVAQGRGAFPVQAFALDRSLAVQFHPEITDLIMDTWMARDHHDLGKPGAQTPVEHRRAHAEHGTANAAWFAALLDRWIVAA